MNGTNLNNGLRPALSLTYSNSSMTNGQEVDREVLENVPEKRTDVIPKALGRDLEPGDEDSTFWCLLRESAISSFKPSPCSVFLDVPERAVRELAGKVFKE